jgi:hypothetical protein
VGNIQYAIGDPFDNMPSNQLANGNFTSALGVTSWTLTNCTAVREADTGPRSDYPDVMKCTAVGSADLVVSSAVTSPVTRKKGVRYSFSVWVKFSVGSGLIEAVLRENGGAEADNGMSTVYQTITDSSAWYNIVGDAVLTENDRTSVVLQLTRASATAGQILTISRARVWVVNEDSGDFIAPVDIWSAGGSEMDGYPSMNLNNSILGVSSRIDISSEATAAYVWFDFGRNVIPEAAFVEGLNHEGLVLVYAANAHSGDSLTELDALTVSQNPFTKRYSRMADLTATPAEYRFWGFKFDVAGADTPLVNENGYYFEMARACWVGEDGLRTIPQNWGTPYRTQPNQLAVSGRYAGGLVFDRNLCPIWMSFALQQDFDRSKEDNIEDHVASLVAMDRTDRILHFENKGGTVDPNNARAYICRQSGSSADYSNWPILTVSMGLEELS